MQTETIDKSQQATPSIDEELIDTLIAISVVAKRLAANLRQQNTKSGFEKLINALSSLEKRKAKKQTMEEAVETIRQARLFVEDKMEQAGIKVPA